MEEYELRFSPMPNLDTGAFKLLELPPDLCKLVEASVESLETLQCATALCSHMFWPAYILLEIRD